MIDPLISTPVSPTPSVRVFRVSRGWRIFITIGGGVAAALFAFAPLAALDKINGDAATIFGTLFFWAWAAFFTCAVIAVHRERVEVLPDRIRKAGFFRTRELRLDNITGFRLVRANATSLLLTAKAGKPKQLRIDLLIERKAEFMQWVRETFPDLGTVDFETEVAEIRTDAALGATEEERLVRLRRAQREVRTLNVATLIASGWGMFWPRPYGWALGVLALLPLAALLVVWRHRAVAQLDGKETGARPSVGLAIIQSALVLALRAFLDWQILDWNSFWLPFLTLASTSALVMWMLAPSARQNRVMRGAYVCFMAVHAYGTVVFLNCYFDRSAPAVHATTITRAHKSGGQDSDYILTVSPWIDGITKREVSVSRRTYERHPVGSSAQVILRSGTLRIPWYYVR